MTAARLMLPAMALFATPLFAQAPAANISPPPEKFAISPGGVDMRSGRYVYSQTDLTIGGEAGGLALTRTLTQPVAGHNNPFANFSHGFDILLVEKRIHVFGNIFAHTPGMPDFQMEVSYGGRQDTFRAEGPTNGFVHESRSGFAMLAAPGNHNLASAVYTYTTGDGTVAVFRPIGSGDCSSVLRCAYVSQVTEADGTRLTFDYDNQGGNGTRPRSVTSSRGYALLLEYGGTLIVKACVLNLALAPKPQDNVCPPGALASATYGYTSAPGTGAPRLVSATDPAGAVWGFTYNGIYMGFVRPGETIPWLINSLQERTNNDGLVQEIVNLQNFADGSSYVYGFGETPLSQGQIPEIAGGSFANAAGETMLEYDFPIRPYPQSQGHGNVSEGGPNDPPSPLVHQVTPGPVRVTDPLGRVTTYDYCDPNTMQNLPPNIMHRCLVQPMPVSTTDPGGIRTAMTWDMYNGNLLERRQTAAAGSGLPVVQSATYICTPTLFRHCRKPVTLTDANVHTTDYTYAPEHGGLLSETGPAVNGIRPQTRHHYAQRHAWISNGAGGYVQAATPVWLRTATSICRTSAATGNPAAPCATAGDEVRTAYDYGPDSGPNTLLLRGQTVSATDSGVTTILRTCYGYDAQGRKISETQPNANLGSCP